MLNSPILKLCQASEIFQKIMLILFVVNFDQRLGTAQSKCQQKNALFTSWHKKMKKEKARKVSQNLTKNSFFVCTQKLVNNVVPIKNIEQNYGANEMKAFIFKQLSTKLNHSEKFMFLIQFRHNFLVFFFLFSAFLHKKC